MIAGLSHPMNMVISYSPPDAHKAQDTWLASVFFTPYMFFSCQCQPLLLHWKSWGSAQESLSVLQRAKAPLKLTMSSQSCWPKPWSSSVIWRIIRDNYNPREEGDPTTKSPCWWENKVKFFQCSSFICVCWKNGVFVFPSCGSFSTGRKWPGHGRSPVPAPCTNLVQVASALSYLFAGQL